MHEQGELPSLFRAIAVANSSIQPMVVEEGRGVDEFKAAQQRYMHAWWIYTMYRPDGNG